MPLQKRLSRKKPLLSQRRGLGKEISFCHEQKNETQVPVENGIGHHLGGTELGPHSPLCVPLAYKAIKQQATKDADGTTTPTAVRPTYNLRQVCGTRRFGC